MTTYDLIKNIGKEQCERMTRAGIIPLQWKRFVLIYEEYVRLVDAGSNKMDAYCEAGAKYYTSEANARRIVARMQSVV